MAELEGHSSLHLENCEAVKETGISIDSWKRDSLCAVSANGEYLALGLGHHILIGSTSGAISILSALPQLVE
jgi:hypothetical protein